MKTLWAWSVLWMAAAGGAQAPSESATDPAREAVTLLRALNTAQAEHNAEAGAYAPLDKVLASATFKKLYSARISATDPVTAATGQTTLTLVVSEDKKHYQADGHGQGVLRRHDVHERRGSHLQRPCARM